ncbi:RING finger protein nenya [Drosophila gunungcola]|nr:RING finger protein nenya [Drosophila gunungcola]
MFRIHCNKCFCRRNTNPTLVFHMSRCQHVICETCLSQSSEEKKCPVCKVELTTVPINRQLPRGVANYFEDPLRFQVLYRKISKFQVDQRASDNRGFYRQMQEHEKNKLRLEGFCKMEAQINQQIQLEKKRIADLRAYISFHEEAAQKNRRRSMDDMHHAKELQRRRGLRPRTPSMSTTDNTQSDEAMETFCLDSDTDFPALGQTRDSRKRRFDGNINEFHI